MSFQISFEVGPYSDKEKVARVYSALGASQVFVTWRPNVPMEPFREFCSSLSQAGINVVPHIVARNLQSADQFFTLLHWFSKKPHIESLLLLGGDAESTLGPYRCASDLFNADCLNQTGVKKVFIAGYPQGHAFISQKKLEASLQKKMDYASASNLELEVVTQLCPSVNKIIDWAINKKSHQDVNVRISVPIGDQSIVERRLKQIYESQIEFNSQNKFDTGPLGFLHMVCAILNSKRMNFNLHLIPFHDLDALQNYTNAINTMLESELS